MKSMKMNKLCKNQMMYVLSPYVFGVAFALTGSLVLYFFVDFAIAYNYAQYTQNYMMVVKCFAVLMILMFAFLAILLPYILLLIAGKKVLASNKSRVLFFIGIVFQLLFPLLIALPTFMLWQYWGIDRILYLF